MAVYYVTSTVHEHGLVLVILNVVAPNTKDCDTCTLFDHGKSNLTTETTHIAVIQ